MNTQFIKSKSQTLQRRSRWWRPRRAKHSNGEAVGVGHGEPYPQTRSVWASSLKKKYISNLFLCKYKCFC